MNRTKSKHIKHPHTIVKESLGSSNGDLTCFYFRYGANVYVFSYGPEGSKKHTFIDSGDDSYRDQMLPALVEMDINPDNIENVIITHRHHDHCALADLLVNRSGGKILAHANFRSFVESDFGRPGHKRSGHFHPSVLKDCRIEYLPESGRNESVNIGGVDFPSMMEPIDIGDAGTLEIMGCPESVPTHSPDQLFARFRLNNNHNRDTGEAKEIRPTDEILFSGDLWLMTGPMFNPELSHLSRHFRSVQQQMKGGMSGGGMMGRDPRIQDAAAKEALKGGFSLITVKPGHGDEFLGSRILPYSFLADRDLLFVLGYSMDADKSLLQSGDLAPKVSEMREESYSACAKELLLWREKGYSSDEISELLARIYREQSGGGFLVEEDRMERRERIQEILSRLKNDKNISAELHDIAGKTLSKVKNGGLE